MFIFPTQQPDDFYYFASHYVFFFKGMSKLRNQAPSILNLIVIENSSISLLLCSLFLLLWNLIIYFRSRKKNPIQPTIVYLVRFICSCFAFFDWLGQRCSKEPTTHPWNFLSKFSKIHRYWKHRRRIEKWNKWFNKQNNEKKKSFCTNF